MRWIAPGVAVALLVAIGAVEASVSAQQLAEAVGRPRLEAPGVTLTAAGLLGSALIYVVLGHLARHDRAAVRTGALAGALAGARYCGVREAHTPSR